MKKIVSQILFLVFMLAIQTTLSASSFTLQSSDVVVNSWPTGYEVIVTLINSTDQPTTSWSASFSLPKGEAITNFWDANYEANGQVISVQNPSWVGGGVIPAQSSTTFGMIISRPTNGSSSLIGLQATANGSTPVSPVPVAPVLNAIVLKSGSSNSYTLSWNSVANATSYLLQQDTTSAFSNPKTIAQGNILSYAFTNQAPGTYFYRVVASDTAGNSPYSNVESIKISPPLSAPVAPVLNAIVLNVGSSNSYTLSWNSVANATSYLLQQDTTSAFSNPKTVAQGNILSYAVTNQAAGTYFYRVVASDTAGNSPYSNVESIKISPPLSVPVAPVLNAIVLNAGSSNSYTLSWNSVANATSYLLQQDTTSAFSNPKTVAQGNILSYVVTNQAAGTYFYRVVASDTTGNSPYSNVESITVSQSTPPLNLGIEHSAWYIDWTAWFTSPTFVIPTSNDTLNIFVGELMYDTNNNPTLGGFGNMTLAQIQSFTTYCAAQNPPIQVKASIGGGGGSYDNCWDVLTESNVQSFAQGLVNFCHDQGLKGIDFDYEEYASAAQETLVGTLIKEFKAIDPTLQASVCTNAGFGANDPWQAVMTNILNAALISPGNCAVDRVYVMSYYNSIEDEEGWILGWAAWLEQNYGFTPARISVGIDDFDAHAYDPVTLATWAASQGFSTAHWAFNPAAPTVTPSY